VSTTNLVIAADYDFVVPVLSGLAVRAMEPVRPQLLARIDLVHAENLIKSSGSMVAQALLKTSLHPRLAPA
jgi:hypothetical protein